MPLSLVWRLPWRAELAVQMAFFVPMVGLKDTFGSGFAPNLEGFLGPASAPNLDSGFPVSLESGFAPNLEGFLDPASAPNLDSGLPVALGSDFAPNLEGFLDSASVPNLDSGFPARLGLGLASNFDAFLGPDFWPGLSFFMVCKFGKSAKVIACKQLFNKSDAWLGEAGRAFF